MQPCDPLFPPLKGDRPEGGATAGAVLIWRSVDAQRYVDECRQRHINLINWWARHPRSRGWLPVPDVR